MKASNQEQRKRLSAWRAGIAKMIWLIDLWWHWNERRKLAKSLRKRKAARIVEQERSRKAHWQAVRKHHARDPLWRGA